MNPTTPNAAKTHAAAQKHAAAKAWLDTLKPEQIDKLVALKEIIEDDDICERMPPLEKVGNANEGHWHIKWNKKA
jgi:hypothetical protein